MCGAPNCCQQCCKISTLTERAERAEDALSAAMALLAQAERFIDPIGSNQAFDLVQAIRFAVSVAKPLGRDDARQQDPDHVSDAPPVGRVGNEK
jgi:hypothetical protein